MTEKQKEKQRTGVCQDERAEKKERKERRKLSDKYGDQTMKEVHRGEIKHNIEKTRSVKNKLKDKGGSKPRI